MKKIILLILIPAFIGGTFYFKELYILYAHGIWVKTNFQTSIQIQSPPCLRSALLDLECDNEANTCLIILKDDFIFFLSELEDNITINYINDKYRTLSSPENLLKFPFSVKYQQNAILTAFSNQYKGDYLHLKATEMPNGNIKLEFHTYWS